MKKDEKKSPKSSNPETEKVSLADKAKDLGKKVASGALVLADDAVTFIKAVAYVATPVCLAAAFSAYVGLTGGDPMMLLIGAGIAFGSYQVAKAIQHYIPEETKAQNSIVSSVAKSVMSLAA